MSRYYDPAVGRFINPDGYISTGQGILGHNMFAYCGNNPINRHDPNGDIAIPMIAAAALEVGKDLIMGLLGLIAVGIATEVIVDNPPMLPDIAIPSIPKAEKKTEIETKSGEISAVIDVPIDSPKENEAIYYGVDLRNKEWKYVTAPMNYERAMNWVHVASAFQYGRSTSWGVYTAYQYDAYKFALELGKGACPIYHNGRTGQYSHYHVNGFVLFNKHKQFHVWYGGLQ